LKKLPREASGPPAKTFDYKERRQAKIKKFRTLFCTFFKKLSIIRLYFLTKEMNDDNETILDIIDIINVLNGHVCKKAGQPAGNF
jgi:hypothetical protein